MHPHMPGESASPPDVRHHLPGRYRRQFHPASLHLPNRTPAPRPPAGGGGSSGNPLTRFWRYSMSAVSSSFYKNTVTGGWTGNGLSVFRSGHSTSLSASGYRPWKGSAFPWYSRTCSTPSACSFHPASVPSVPASPLVPAPRYPDMPDTAPGNSSPCSG